MLAACPLVGRRDRQVAVEQRKVIFFGLFAVALDVDEV